ncbi:VOC family protein [Luteolibacter yonseiensis]|uniref:VOC family protein n=1 Tax=Luteolibacter yonseiensis TaxID=1144680 RepID=A0A934R2J9_9BACT|nr:VOC family protein [Luteolibacter yonseiensis]MBK1815116.1 VOC family protein [Luteolibacter yonseiensis]
MKLHRIDHIGITVRDLPAMRDFLLALGMEVIGEDDVSGPWVDRVIGLDNARSSIAMLKTPDGNANIELVQFHHPASPGEATPPHPMNVPGLRHLAFTVGDLEGTVAHLRQKGAELLGEIVNYRDIYKLCCIRGPEGIILELAEEL